MRMPGTIPRAVLGIVLAGSLLLQPLIAMAQDTGLVSDNEYVLTYGATLTWDDPWVVDEEESGFTTEQLGDFISFQASPTALMQFSTLPAIGDLPTFLQTIATNVSGSSGDVLEIASDKEAGYAYIEAEQGSTEVAFSIFLFRTEDLATEQVVILITEPGNVGEWLSSVQDTFVLDGEPLLPNIDAAEAQSTFGTADQGDAGNDDADEKKLPDEPADEGDEIEGMTGDRTYESPQWGTAVEWNQRWIADEALATSDTDEAVDYLALSRRGGEASLSLSLRDSSVMSPGEWMTTFIDGIASGDDFEIFDSDNGRAGAWILYEREIDGIRNLGYIEAYVGEANVLIVVEVAGPLSQREFAGVFDAAQASVTIDGDAPFILANDTPEFP